MQKLLIFFSAKVCVYAIFIDQSFNNMLTIDIISFEHLGPGYLLYLELCLDH